MAYIITGIISILTSIIAGVALFVLKQKMNENKELKRQKEAAESAKDKAIENGIVCILRKHLMDEHECWTARGYITPKALESGLLMYKAYKDLGGNGMIDHMEEEIQRLPIHE